jgi:phosphoribosylanthranilate isomerase
MLKLKVCGMRDEKNLSNLIELQPDFIGLIFHEKSPRNISKPILLDLPSNILFTGVFVNKSEDFITQKIAEYGLESIQLHGTESPDFCKKIKESNQKVIKAFNIHPEFDFSALDEYTPYCDYFLFDAFGKDAGGNGITFDWNILNNYKGKTPFLLSGGIDGNMTKNLKEINHPMFKGVDINSKFESAYAYKDIKKVKQFSDELRS